MHKLRRLATIAAVCAALIGTVLAGSAQAATGGGCGTKTNNIQACASWVTGQGLSYNFFLEGWGPVQFGEVGFVDVWYCKTSSVATSSTSCGTFVEQAATRVWWAADHLGQYPAGTVTWSASRSNHGIAYSAVYWDDPNDGVPRVATSKKVYW